MTVKVVATNRKAFHEYFISDTFEAGIALLGTEIKSVRAGRVSLQDGYVSFEQGEAWLLNIHIAQYDPASRQNHDPKRRRKLLLHRREIDRLAAKVQEKGFTVIPTRLYLKDGRAKVEIGLAKGKRLYDKRETIAKRDSQRQIDRAIKEQYK